MVLHFSHLAETVKIQTAFLHRDLKEEISMECPKGMSNVKEDNCIILNKCIYGLSHAACQYYEKGVEILKSSSFVRGSIGPCLYVKGSTKGIVYIALHVDDNLMKGNIATNNDAIDAWTSKRLVLKIMDGLQDYLSCKIKISDDKKHT